MASCLTSSAQTIASPVPNSIDFKTKSRPTEITIFWELPEKCMSFDEYVIKYKKNGQKMPISYLPLENVMSSVTLTKLDSDTMYELIVCLVKDGLESLLFKCEQKTEKKRVTNSLYQTTSSKSSLNGLTIYHLQPQDLIKESQHSKHVRVCQMLLKNHPEYEIRREVKSILLVGDTGSGKSTMLDSMINYIAGVTRKDTYRIRLINKTEEEKKVESHRVESQTSAITCYRIPQLDENKVDFHLNLIDTPGFGDTRGKEFDKRIPDYLTWLLEEFVGDLSAICIVMSLSNNRLGDAQKYVLENIMKLFDKTIKDNIFVFITHHDGCPKNVCLDVFEENGIDYKDYFCFNNGIVFTVQDDNAWDTNSQNFERFFKTLSTTQTKTVGNMVDVMKKRKMLQIKLNNLLVDLRAHVDNTCVRDRELAEKKSINCPTCRKTCHQNCWVPGSPLIWSCCVMSRFKCTYCGCKSGDHVVEKYYYTLKFLDKNRKEEPESEQSVIKTVKDIKSLIRDLGKIALSADEIRFEKLISEIIVEEEKEKQVNYKDRIKCLEKIKQKFSKN